MRLLVQKLVEVSTRQPDAAWLNFVHKHPFHRNFPSTFRTKHSEADRNFPSHFPGKVHNILILGRLLKYNIAMKSAVDELTFFKHDSNYEIMFAKRFLKLLATTKEEYIQKRW
uniref:Uncharacterized protein n=1 Tax=Parascaris equorum TaxID=6256 RepID=A0A914SFU0_PAREQ